MSVPGLPSIPLYGGPRDGGGVDRGAVPGDTLVFNSFLRGAAPVTYVVTERDGQIVGVYQGEVTFT